MSIGKHLSRGSICSLALWMLVCSPVARTQSSAPPPIAESRLSMQQVLSKLVEKNAERADALQKYQGRRFYSLDYKGFPTSFHAEMVVDMTYMAPATKQFKIVSQSGPDWLVDRVLKRLLETEQEASTEENRARVALDSSNYEFSGFEHLDALDNCSYVISVEPKIPSKLLYRGRIWVDSTDFSVCRIEAEPSKNPSFWIKKTDIHHSYLKIGDFWLPEKNESVSAIRGGGRAVLIIKYQNYEILAAHGLKGSDVPPSSSSLVLSDHSN
jgi:hypothetical protein